MWSLVAHRGLLYVGGYFDFIGGRVRTALAAVDTLSGAATEWDPEGNNIVMALATLGDTLYAGGVFTSMSGQKRNHLASFDLGTGALTSWDPSANSDVFGLTARGQTIYVAGFFSTIAGVSRRYGLAAIDGTTGTATDWNPQSDNWVNTVAVYRDAVFVGGRFNTIGGQPRTNLAALNAVTGQATLWICNTNAEVFALTEFADTLFVGGRFFVIGGEPRNGLAAVDMGSGTLLPWNPGLSISEWLGEGSYPDVYSLVIASQELYVGGAFGRLGDVAASNLAGISLGSPPAAPPPFLALAGPMPNPVRGSGIIRFSLPTAGSVTLVVYDIQGRRVTTLLDHEAQAAGRHDVAVRADRWKPGVYFCRLEAGGRSAAKKMIVLQ